MNYRTEEDQRTVSPEIVLSLLGVHPGLPTIPAAKNADSAMVDGDDDENIRWKRLIFPWVVSARDCVYDARASCMANIKNQRRTFWLDVMRKYYILETIKITHCWNGNRARSRNRLFCFFGLFFCFFFCLQRNDALINRCSFIAGVETIVAGKQTRWMEQDEEEGGWMNMSMTEIVKGKATSHASNSNHSRDFRSRTPPSPSIVDISSFILHWTVNAVACLYFIDPPFTGFLNWADRLAAGTTSWLESRKKKPPITSNHLITIWLIYISWSDV